MRNFLSGPCGKMSSINNLQIKSHALSCVCVCVSQSSPWQIRQHLGVFQNMCQCVCVSAFVFCFPLCLQHSVCFVSKATYGGTQYGWMFFLSAATLKLLSDWVHNLSLRVAVRACSFQRIRQAASAGTNLPPT